MITNPQDRTRFNGQLQNISHISSLSLIAVQYFKSTRLTMMMNNLDSLMTFKLALGMSHKLNFSDQTESQNNVNI